MAMHQPNHKPIAPPPPHPTPALQLAFIRERQAAGRAVQLHEVEVATHWLPLSHEAELLAAMCGELAALK